MTPAEQILRRVQDDELSLSDFPGGIMDRYVRQLADDELVELQLNLDYLARAETDQHLRRRYNTVDFLKRDAKRRSIVSGERVIQDLAATARRTGRETCQCGARHEPGANYYVSVVDGGKTVLLSGPYSTHAECLGALPTAKNKAEQVDPESHFYSFGTIAVNANVNRPGILDPL